MNADPGFSDWGYGSSNVVRLDFSSRADVVVAGIFEDEKLPPNDGVDDAAESRLNRTPTESTSPSMDRELIDAKLATVEARSDAKFSELKGEFSAGQERIATMFAELRADLAAQQGATNTAIADLRGDLKTAQSDTQGKIETVKASVDAKPGKFDVWGGLLALFVAFIAVLAFGGDRLSTGIGLADQRQEQLERDRQQDNAAIEINSKLDKLLLNSQ